MEKVIKAHSIKQSFVMAVSITMLIVFTLSAITVLGCYHIQKILLPDSNEIWLHTQTIMPDGTVTEAKQRFLLNKPEGLALLVPADDNNSVSTQTQFIIEKIESSFSELTPKKKMLYRILNYCMFVLPFLYSIVGIGLCAWWFYRKKLQPPIQALSRATGYIREQNLDFTVEFQSGDELGQLCEAFEKMRHTLYDNNRRIWNMMEERRVLQASVAHDLRNPIAIILGYVEYMQQSLKKERLDRDKLENNLNTLFVTTKRMERYTDYIKDLNAMEETDTNYTEVCLPRLFENVIDSFRIMAEQNNCKLTYNTDISECQIKLDEEIFYRVLENVFANAMRYARSQVAFEFSLKDNILLIVIKDDGEGFSSQMIRKKDTLFYSEDKSGQHFGLGLATSRILCQKHGGSIELSNIEPNGACVQIKLMIVVE